MNRRATPLRRQVLTAIVGIAALAVVLFAIPLAVAVQRLYREEAITALERDATRVAAVVPDDIAVHRTLPRIPRGLSSRQTVGVYGLGGEHLVGAGPAWSDVARRARDGRSHEAVERGALTVSTPVPSGQGPVAVVRISTPYKKISDRTWHTWLLMTALALIVLFLATVYARRQAARLAGPLERLTTAAQALGGGDFSVRAQRSGVPEADAAGLALEATARRLGDVLERERAFSADVSHQLRTPLTGMLLGLESALTRPGADPRAAIRTALKRGEHLQDIIEDLLRLARDSRPRREVLDLTALLAEVRAQWQGPLTAAGRSLTVTGQQPLPEVRAAPGAIRQILDVLIDNALRHGRGRITVAAVDVGSGVAIEVGDEGPGVPEGDDLFVRGASASADGEGHGIGLALARSLAEAEGGRLVLRRPEPPVFTLLLPGEDA
ncbi:HAMP domain-containing sensor histidine kinase [Actinomadura scrupuli]|uniref:sensor histidine kinase n=1 Tax=Actinomadura scrupuli TaxID=559629 RepID=UPI003D967162